MTYKPIPEMTRAEIEDAVEADNPDELYIAVLAAALYSQDLEWAQSICLALSSHPHWNVRGNAVLGFGHLARLHGSLNEERIKPVIESALTDSEEYVRGQAYAAMEDVEQYLEWEVRRP